MLPQWILQVRETERSVLTIIILTKWIFQKQHINKSASKFFQQKKS
jgi:hypothetical protein